MIPTYERRTLVLEAVASALAQTVPEVEVLVVDDGSTDGTGEALAALEPRVRCLRQENRGVSAARNAGLALASGPVVAFLDSDNRWRPGHLELVLGALERHPEAVLASACPRFSLEGGEGVEDARLVESLPRALFANQVGFLSCVAARREALVAVGGFDEAHRVGEDTDLFARLALLGPFVAVAGRTLLRRDRSPDSLRRRFGRPQEYLAVFRRSAARVLADAEAAGTARAAGAIPTARAAVAYVEALAALREGDDEALVALLRKACELCPELSRDPHLALGRAINLGLGPSAGRGARLTRLVRAWPDPHSPTVTTLRWALVLAALRRRRLGAAARELAAAPALWRHPRTLARGLPEWRLTRRRRRAGRRSARALGHR